MNLKNYFYVVIIFLIIAACSNSTSNKFEVELNDSVKQVILAYIKENNIDSKAKVITTDWIVSDYRTDVYISNIQSKLYQKTVYTPTYYSIIDGDVVVFIYTGIEAIMIKNTDEILYEIDDVLIKLQVELSPDSGDFYYARSWQYSTCNEESILIKKLPPFEYNFIPCGYKLLQDSIFKDSLYVVKRKN